MNSQIAPPECPAADRAQQVRSMMPTAGLFAGHEWRVATDPFALSAAHVGQVQELGRILLQFYRAVNLLYRKSVEGKEPAWVAEWLDQGKPADLVLLQRSSALKNELPRVIRPDLLITQNGLSITELDSVPGGIGLTAWLNQAYSKTGSAVLGGEQGMLDGFLSIFGAAERIHIVVSEEAGTYRPEMEWIASQLKHSNCAVRDAQFREFSDGDALYRFFELFDLQNVPSSELILRLAREKRIRLTPPPKPVFEEKMLFALLWNRNLDAFWKQELGGKFYEKLKGLVPYSWVVHPAPLPPHGAIPHLDLTAWWQLKTLSQKERDLILKISGFSPHAWGARGVFLGSDLPHAEWAAAVDKALASFDRSPYVLQRYHKPALVDAQWFDFDAAQVRPMNGRVRLCPYYFVSGEGDAARAALGGVLATICPADKKIIHGMTDAIFAPCTAAPQSE